MYLVDDLQADIESSLSPVGRLNEVKPIGLSEAKCIAGLGCKSRQRGEFDTLEKNDDQKNLDYSNRLLR